MIKLLALLTMLSLSCAKGGSMGDPIPRDIVERLKILEHDIEEWSVTCSFKDLTYPCEAGNEDHVTLWAGLACLSGDQMSCLTVKAAQGQDGKIWRSPSQIDIKNENSSSRDMFDGFLAYLVATKDQDAAIKALKYIESHDNTLCDDADDNRCSMNKLQYKAVWDTFARVYSYIGLDVPDSMKLAALGGTTVLYVQSVSSPAGYRSHLNAVQIHIRKRVGQKSHILDLAIANIAKRQDRNPYFSWLDDGINSYARSAALVLSACPNERPSAPKGWIWEKDQDVESFTQPMGSDCLFMIRNLLKE